MARFEGGTFTDTTVAVDGHEYDRCTFRRCTLVYSGLDCPRLTNNEFDSCRWTFDDAAGRTLAFLKDLHAGGWRQLVEQTFADITNPAAPPGQQNVIH